MSDLTDFILARVAEDEAAARAAARGPWEYQDVDSVGGGRVCDPTVNIATLFYDPEGERVDPRIRRTVSWREADRTGEHIVRWDPTRVLAECESKRRLVEEHGEGRPWGRPDPGKCRVCTAISEHGGAARFRAPCPTLRLLALPYAGHEDYLPEWAV